MNAKTILFLLVSCLAAELLALSFLPKKPFEKPSRSASRQKKFLRAQAHLHKEHNLKASHTENIQPEQFVPTTPSNGAALMTIHLLILPVDYPGNPDHAMTLTQAQVSNLFFNSEATPPANYNPQPPYSVEDYFLLMSKKTFQFKGEILPTFRLAHEKEFYSEQAERETGLLHEVADHLESYTATNPLRASRFDKNEDGYLDILVILHSGEGEETDPEEGSIISHMSSYSLKAVLNSRFLREVRANPTNLKLGRYTIVPEFNNTAHPRAMTISGNPIVAELATIGTICHELGHCLGLVDLYNTDNSTLSSRQDVSIGRSALMSVGNYNYGNHTNSTYMLMGERLPITGDRPAPLIGLHKILLGWEEPIVLDPSDEGDYFVGDFSRLDSSNTLYKIMGPSKTQYWLLENRQGSYLDDGFLEGKGLFIWHVNEERLGDGSALFLTDKGVQNDPTKRAIQLEEPGVPNPTNQIRRVLPRHFWTNSFLGFTPGSTPNSHYALSDTPSGVFLTEIFPSENSPTSNMHFKLNIEEVAGYTEDAVSYPSPFVAGNGAVMRIRVRANRKVKQFPSNLLLKIVSKRGKVIQTFNALHNTIFFEDNNRTLTANWDGRDSKGKLSPVGVYYYLITHNEFHYIVGRFLLLR